MARGADGVSKVNWEIVQMRQEEAAKWMVTVWEK